MTIYVCLNMCKYINTLQYDATTITFMLHRCPLSYDQDFTPLLLITGGLECDYYAL